MKWIVTGSSGLLGHSLCEYLVSHDIEVTGLHFKHPINVANIKSHQIDLLDFAALTKLIEVEAPDVIVHTAGLTDVDGCEKNEKLANTLHAEIPKILASITKNSSIQCVNISTDHLSDGTEPFVTEDKLPQPVNAYARSKYLGEVKALEANSECLILRTNFFGPGLPWRLSFSDWIINSLKNKQPITTFTDAYFTPISLSHLCPLLHGLVTQEASGIFNVAGRERVSKYEFSIRLATFLGLDSSFIQPGGLADAHLAAQRPVDMSLATEKIEKIMGKFMPGLDECFASLIDKSHNIRDIGKNND
jgi:dTDP-4-dehydrorhamnose reductase